MKQAPGSRPDGPSRGEVDDPTATRILNNAIELVAQHGHAELSVDRLAKAAGIGRSTFYEHFPDSGACFQAALERIAADLLERVRSASRRAGPGSRAIATMQPVLELAQRDEPAARCLLLEALGAGPKALETRDGFCDETAVALGAAWSGGREPRPGTAMAASTVVGGTARLLAMRLRRGALGIDPELGEGLRAWIAAYRPPEEEREAWAPLPAREVSSSMALVGAHQPAALAPGRHGLPKAEVARHQRERILAAVAGLSHERGYASVTVADITARARVSRSAFYRQFRDRAEAAMEANEGFFQRAMAAAAGAFFAETRWPERVWASGRTLLDFLAAHPANAHLGFVEPHAIGPAGAQLSYERLSAFTLFLEEGYRCLPQGAELSRVSSEALAAVMFEVTYRELRRTGTTAALPSHLPALAYMTLAPFLGPRQARRFVEDRASGGR